jgi:2'-hydroxyisoflavone reductase
MRILILGGTVFLSATLARDALARGHEVTCLARGTSPAPPGVQFLAADRDDGRSAYDGASGRWDAVLDVSRQPDHVRDALEALADRSGHWTFVSSGSVYAHFDDPPGLGESAELLPALAAGLTSTPETYGEGKVACEQYARDAVGDRLHISRAGLIAGPGDPTDRFGYWPARFARTSPSAVLVPDARDDDSQVIGVDDLSRWLLDAAEAGVSGTYNSYGDPYPLGQVIDLAAAAAGSTSEQVVVDRDWLVEHEVAYWSGPESLPLWLPPTYTGFRSRSNAAARAAGMRLAPLEDLIVSCLTDERSRGLDRPRKAGLSPARESALLEQWQSHLATA